MSRKGTFLRKGTAMRDLVRQAEALGFSVGLTRSHHLVFRRVGLQPIYASSSPSDHHSWLNTLAQLRRAVRSLDAGDSPCATSA